MTLRVRDPRAEINKPPSGRRIRTLEVLEGTRVGLLWSQHASSEKFWPVFEQVVEQRFHPSRIVKLYKHSTWNVATPEEVADFAQNVDYALVGVGG
jgi:hypothetical protein